VTRLCFFLLAALVCGKVLAEARIDSRTPESFNRTLARMMRELPPRKAAELNTAIASLPFAGMTSVKDTPADGIVKLDLKKIDGMTADQIIDLAQKTVTVKISSGPPPGLPQRFKVPLPAAPAQTEAGKDVASLAGTQWDVTDDLNGFISHEHLTLRVNGEVDDGTSSHNHWEQVGNAVRITINDSYAVYLGTADEAKSMQGAAANLNGSEWTWVARRGESK
jgi:hypothetical protein